MKRSLLAGVVTLLVGLPLYATRVRRLSPAELEAQAAEVLIIDVLGSSQRVGDANMVWTDYRVRTADGRVLMLPFANNILGVPRLEIGGRYVIYLDDAPRRPVPAVGWSQGIVRLDGDDPGHSGSCTCGGFASLPIPWEIDHPDPDYAAAAAVELERWNQFIDAFDVRIGDGVAGPNGVNEIAFFDRATASAKYGINMDRNTFAVTYVTPISAAGGFDGCPVPPDTVCGTFAEADVIMNTEFVRGFTAFGPLDYADRGPALYGATAAHELGHALGFHHNVNNISVMNLYEDFAARYIAAADVAEARTAYASRAKSVTDLAAYPFSFDPALTDYAATEHVDVSPTRVAPGGTIVVKNFGFENVGTDAPPGVELRIMLSRNAIITLEDTEIASIGMSGPFWDDGGEGETIVLPLGLAKGTYYLGAVVTYGGDTIDPVTDNNSWIAPQRVTIGSAMRRRTVRRH
jgi:hypothetical protein